MQRVFAELNSGQPGPLVIVIAALHGNEHAGVHAMSRLQNALCAQDFAGKVVGVVGNLGAYLQNQRYLDADLNRIFLTDRLAQCPSEVREVAEAKTLIETINTLIGNHDGEVHLLDVHSMSGEGLPFSCFPHTDTNEKIAQCIPLPAIADIVQILPGTLTEYFAHKLTTTMVVECGQHVAEITKENAYAALLSYLDTIGVLRNQSLAQRASEHLKAIVGEYADVFTRVNFRYHIVNQGYFEMQPGYSNLQDVAVNELLAIDRACEVRAPHTGRVVLPCYQKQGDDGFFIAVDEQ